MAGKKFTEEEKEILRQNPYVESVENTRIIYTEEFKVYYMKNYLAGKKPTEIFVSAGFDPVLMGNKRIERASARWRKLYADGLLKVDDVPETEKVAETAESYTTADTEEAVAAVENKAEEKPAEAPKKRRGRPRKNAAAETKSEYEANVKAEAAPKKPRKKRVNKIALMAQNIKKAEEKVKEEQAQPQAEENTAVAKEEQPVEAPKKRRGRPRKNPEAVEAAKSVKAEETAEAPKKRRGRPRKNPEAVKAVEPAKAEPVKVEKAVKAEETTVEAPKKRRGRPRKNPEAATVKTPAVKVEKSVQTVPAAPAPQTDVTVQKLVTALQDLMEEVHLLRGELALSNKNR